MMVGAELPAAHLCDFDILANQLRKYSSGQLQSGHKVYMVMMCIGSAVCTASGKMHGGEAEQHEADGFLWQ